MAATAQAAIDMEDAKVGDHFGAVGDRPGDDQVAHSRINLLAGTHRTGVVLGTLHAARRWCGQDRFALIGADCSARTDGSATAGLPLAGS